MPIDVNALTDARGHFLKFGTEPDSKSAEGRVVKTNEMDQAPAGDDATPGSAVAGHQCGEGRPLGQRLGRRPVLLDGPAGRRGPGTAGLDDARSGSVPGDTTIDVVDATGINAGDALRLGSPPEQATSPRWPGTRSRSPLPLGSAHAAGDPVVRPAGDVTYMEDELTQDACAQAAMQSFAKTSDPVVTTESDTPFASGLSPDGKLVSAKTPAPRFYGYPLVAWQPIVSAGQYEVQWSRKLYPWTTAGSQLTWGTSLTLPLAPGTWYYRVRGLDFLMSGYEAADVVVGPGPRRGHEAALPRHSLGAFEQRRSERLRAARAVATPAAPSSSSGPATTSA